MFVSKRKVIRDYLKGKDFQSIDDITTATNLSKSKVKAVLHGLKGKEVECVDDKWRLLPSSSSIISEEVEQLEGVLPTPSTISIPSPVPSDPYSIPKEQPKTIMPPLESKKEGLAAKLGDLEQKLDILVGSKQVKEKKAKLKRFNIRRLKRYNKKKNRAVFLLGNDQSIKVIKGEYFESYKILKVNETYYHAGAVFTWIFEGKQPVYIIQEWSLEPLAAEGLYARAKSAGALSDPQFATIQAAMMIEQDKEESQGKGKMSPMMIIGVVIACAVVGWILFGGKK